MARNHNKPIPPFTQKAAARFWSKVSKSGPNDCWLWTGATYSRDPTYHYGKVRRGVYPGTTYKAHRVAYYLHFGVDPVNSNVLHKCDNPPCCNPAHLILGTGRDNIIDKYTKNRGTARLTTEQVREIYRRYHIGKEKNKALSKEFGVREVLIWRITCHRTWRFITDSERERIESSQSK